MTEDERRKYVKFRLESAYHTYEAAKILFDNEFWNSSVFYAVNALLVLNNIQPKTH